MLIFLIFAQLQKLRDCLLAFLRYNELASLRCWDVDVSSFDTFVEIYVFKNKTDVYGDETHVLLAKLDSVSCPFHML